MLNRSFVMITFLLLAFSFSCKNNTENNTNEQNKNVGNIEEENMTQKNTTKEKFKKITNARFEFSIEIPTDWKAEELSANNDGFFITPDDADIDIRAYGAYIMTTQEDFYQQIFDEYSDVYDFEFDDGSFGLKARYETSLYYFRIEDEVVKHFYVDGPESWINKNIELLDQIASTLK